MYIITISEQPFLFVGVYNNGIGHKTENYDKLPVAELHIIMEPHKLCYYSPADKTAWCVQAVTRALWHFNSGGLSFWAGDVPLKSIYEDLICMPCRVAGWLGVRLVTSESGIQSYIPHEPRQSVVCTADSSPRSDTDLEVSTFAGELVLT